MTLYEFLKYHEGETIKIRRISWEQDVYILCAIDGFIEHAVKTSQGKEFSYPWMPWHAVLERGDCAGVYVQGLCDSTHRGMPRPVLSGERMQNMRTGNASSLGRSVEQ